MSREKANFSQQLLAVDRVAEAIERYRHTTTEALVAKKSGWFSVRIKLDAGQIRTVQLNIDEDLTSPE